MFVLFVELISKLVCLQANKMMSIDIPWDCLFLTIPSKAIEMFPDNFTVHLSSVVNAFQYVRVEQTLYKWRSFFCEKCILHYREQHKNSFKESRDPTTLRVIKNLLQTTLWFLQESNNIFPQSSTWNQCQRTQDLSVELDFCARKWASLACIPDGDSTTHFCCKEYSST